MRKKLHIKCLCGKLSHKQSWQTWLPLRKKLPTIHKMLCLKNIVRRGFLIVTWMWHQLEVHWADLNSYRAERHNDPGAFEIERWESQPQTTFQQINAKTLQILLTSVNRHISISLTHRPLWLHSWENNAWKVCVCVFTCGCKHVRTCTWSQNINPAIIPQS